MSSKERERSTPFGTLISKLAKAFSKARIPYMIFGGQAVLLYGEPRFTQDIDITLGVDTRQAPKVLAIIRTLKLRPLVDDPEDFLKRTFVLPVADLSSGIRADLVFSLSQFELEAIKRARKVRVAGSLVAFVGVEDLIILKMIAGRPRDIEDVRGILAKNESIQRAHIMRWLRAYDEELYRPQ